MNKDINIVLPAADTVANAVQVIDGLLGTYKNAGADRSFSFPWKKLSKVVLTPPAAAATSDYTFLPTGVAAGSVHSFFITQSAGDNNLQTLQVSYTANASDTVATVSDQLIVIINALESTGLIDVTLTDLGVAGVQIEGTAANPVAAVSGPQGGTNTLATLGSEAVGAGADLLALGVADTFDGDLPLAADSYAEYRFEFMAPKGHGGINGQTSDQEHVLRMFADSTAGAGYTALDAVIDSLIDGSYTTAELLGANV
jgi:hypothetical protein